MAYYHVHWTFQLNFNVVLFRNLRAHQIFLDILWSPWSFQWASCSLTISLLYAWNSLWTHEMDCKIHTNSVRVTHVEKNYRKIIWNVSESLFITRSIIEFNFRDCFRSDFYLEHTNCPISLCLGNMWTMNT